MNDIYQKLGSAVKLWRLKETPGWNSVKEVSEAWFSHETGSVTVQHRTVEPAELEQWLEQTSKASDQDARSLVLRLVWVRVDPRERRMNMSKATSQKLLSAFGLGLAYDYFQSSVCSATALPEETTADGPRSSYAFSYAPKLGSIWSCTHRPPPYRCDSLTQGIIFVREPSAVDSGEEDVIKSLKGLLGSNWDAGLVSHAMFPAHLLALLLGIQIDLTQHGMTPKIHGLEATTGYHVFKTKRHLDEPMKEPSTGKLQKLSAEASGYATKLASVERKSKTTEQLLDLISRELDSEAEGSVHPAEAAESWRNKLQTVLLFRHQIGVLRQRHDMQALDTQYIIKRVEIQIQALFHIIAQNDALSNYKLSRQMAQVAEYSYRDAASMKTLAVVTMFFLPGSFVSALLSTDLFAWDEVDMRSSTMAIPTTPQLGLYWLITIPLTALTFGLYFLWLRHQKKERTDRVKSDAQMDEEASTEATEDEGKTTMDRMKTFVNETSRFSYKV